MIRFVGIALLFAILAFVLRSFGFRGAPVFALICSVMLLGEAKDSLDAVFSSVKLIGSNTGISEPLSAALKVLGLGYLFGICSDVCRDIGEPGIAKTVEVVGRVEIIAVVIPFFEEIIKTGVDLVG